jgi:hypothetical protein
MDIEMTVTETQSYTPPTVTPSGDASVLTQGSAGNNNADDTQYWQ